MDCRETVKPAPLAGAWGRIEQAIFTSIRSPMGEGYRIVACSGAIGADEKQEIIRRSPSHGALCDATEGAWGLSSYTLQSGRRCVSVSRGAGREHTARGGQRLHTHVLVLDRADFGRLGWDPFAVRQLLYRLAGDELIMRPPPHLPPLVIDETDDGPSAPPVCCGDRDLDRVLFLLCKILEGARVLTVGVSRGEGVVQPVLQAVPAVVRAELSLSWGLKPAPARDFQWILIPAAQDQVERLPGEGEGVVFDWSGSAVCRSAASPFGPWAEFVGRLYRGGRQEDLAFLTERLDHESAPGDLQRTAALCTDLETLQGADLETVERLLAAHAHAATYTPLQAALLDEIRAAGLQRRQVLLDAARDEAEPTSRAAPHANHRLHPQE